VQENNQLGPEGAGILAEALGNMTGMETIDLVRACCCQQLRGCCGVAGLTRPPWSRW
jgi:hypothetical protein